MTSDQSDSGRMLDKAAEAVRGATEAVQATSESIASAINEGRRPGRVLDQLTRLTQKAPLGSLAVAFLLGVLFARRR
jgi:hypothetical protein